MLQLPNRCITSTHSITISPQDSEHYGRLLRRCGSSRNLAEGREVHARLVSAGLEQNGFLQNLLIEMYGNCGSLKDAKQVFEGTGRRNLYTWNIIIAAFVKNNDLQGARELFDAATERDHVTWNTLIAAYAQRGHLDVARSMFDCAPFKNIVSWNTMIASYAQRGQLERAKILFDQMSERNVVTWNSMMTAYAQHGFLEEAKRFFDNMPLRNVVSWNAIISAHLRNEDSVEALWLFCIMDLEGVEGDKVTLVGGLDACANLGDITRGRIIHESFRDSEVDLTLQNSLINMYGKCGSLQEARLIFERMHRRDVVSWTAMVAAFTRNLELKQALLLFKKMVLEGEKPDEVAIVCALDASGELVSATDGRMIHSIVMESDSSIVSHPKVESALISMYGKCGSLGKAQSILEKLHTPDPVSWTAMIASYAQQGLGKQALSLFHVMLLEGVFPDLVTFTSVLCACNHGGQVHDGRSYLLSAIGDFGLKLEMEHYASMVDMLGRSGRLIAAEELMATMPFEPDVYSWIHLLSACKTQSQGLEEGQRAARLVTELDPGDPTPYVMLSSLYRS